MARTNVKQGQVVRITKTYFASGFEVAADEVPGKGYADFKREGRGRLMVRLHEDQPYVALTDDGEQGMYVRADVDGKSYACPTLEGTYRAEQAELAAAS